MEQLSFDFGFPAPKQERMVLKTALQYAIEHAVKHVPGSPAHQAMLRAILRVGAD